MGLPLCTIVMGVSGAGKSTVGKALAAELRCPFYDGDDFHPRENIAKMKSGQPLNDADRLPWLRSLHEVIQGHVLRGQRSVLACSALKSSYRAELRGQLDTTQVGFVHLRPSNADLQSRLEKRSQGGAHFMPVSLLESQLDTLEVEAGGEMIATIQGEEPSNTDGGDLAPLC